MARNARPALWLLPIGLALGHVVGSCFSEHADGAAFEYGDRVFPALGLLGVPLAVFALLRLFNHGQARLPVRLSYGGAIVTQVAAFLAIEVVEHLVTGASLGRMLGHAGLWWALVGQIVVAYLVVSAGRLAVAAGQARADRRVRPEWPPVSTRMRPGLLSDLVQQWRYGGSVQRRGPPLTLLR